MIHIPEYRKVDQIHRQAARARKLKEEGYKNTRSVFLKAIADVEDAPDESSDVVEFSVIQG